MASLAFSTAILVNGSPKRTRGTRTRNQTSRRPSIPRVAGKPLWYASGAPESDRNGSSTDDDALNSELQAKVNELFGGRKNVSIDIEGDAGAKFVVRKGPGSTEYQQTRAAWTVIASIGIISVVAGIVFTALYYTGAIHGSNPSERRYEMPSYGSQSYMDPYDLLEEDRQLQDSKTQ